MAKECLNEACKGSTIEGFNEFCMLEIGLKLKFLHILKPVTFVVQGCFRMWCEKKTQSIFFLYKIMIL